MRDTTTMIVSVYLTVQCSKLRMMDPAIQGPLDANRALLCELVTRWLEKSCGLLLSCRGTRE